MMKTNRRIDIIDLSIAGCLAIVPLVMIQDGMSEEVLRILARATAHLSFIFFASGFFATTLDRWFPGRASRWLVFHRRRLGLAFAYLHASHMVVVAFLAALGADLGVSRYSVGWPALFLVLLMALTSNDTSQRRLGVVWKRLHVFGGYLIAYVFGLSLLPSITESFVSLILFVMVLIGIVLRTARRTMDARRTRLTCTPLRETKESTS